jgi:hypothetical protein
VRATHLVAAHRSWRIEVADNKDAQPAERSSATRFPDLDRAAGPQPAVAHVATVGGAL